MPHVTLKEILKDTRERKYGVPCPAGANLEMTIGIIRAAEELRAPVIICYNQQLTPDIPIEMTMPILVNAAKRAKVPVATTLDHGSDFDLIMKSIHYGSSSVMFDGSALPFEENIKRTSEIVNIAHALGVSVEAELGGVGGSAVEAGATSSTESIATVPAEAVEFVKRTGIDALAIAFGNIHGRYKGKPDINLGLVREIASIIDIPLVMHGASGLTFDYYKKIVDSGISKINYFSAMCRGIYGQMKEFLETSGEDAFCINTIPMSIDFWYKENKKLLEVLNCAGKAGFSAGNGNNSFNIRQELVDSISEEILKNLKKHQ
ncbi:MAG: class II fructose-bisphosphate aldolase, partial [Candidatus Humimicrobiaceae bacterium]